MDDDTVPADAAPGPVEPHALTRPHALTQPDADEAPQTEAETEDPPPSTGDPAVDEATAEVAATVGQPLEARLAAYERAHRALQDRLANVEG